MFKNPLRLMIAIAHPKAEDVFYDLGCGDGRSLTIAVGDYGVARAVGYDISYFPIILAHIRRILSTSRDRIFIKRCDVRFASFTDANIIYMFLMPKIVSSIVPHLIEQTKPGTRIISAVFPINIGQVDLLKLVKKEKCAGYYCFLYERV